MTIKTRLMFGFGFGFGLIIAALIVVSVMGVSNISSIRNKFKEQISTFDSEEKAVDQLVSDANARAISARNLVIADTDRGRSFHRDQVMSFHQGVADSLTQLGANVRRVDPSGKAVVPIYNKIASIEQEYSAVALEVVSLVDQGRTEQAISLINARCQPLLDQLTGEILRLQAASKQLAYERSEQEFSLISTLVTVMIFVSLAAIIGSVALLILITRSIVQPVQQAVAAAEQISKGDLSCHLEVQGNDEISQLLRCLENMRLILTSLIDAIHHSADEVAIASNEIAQGNMSLSVRSEMQASSLEETAASMEEMSSVVRSNLSNTEQARSLSTRAAQVAADGKTAMEQVSTTMSQIGSDSAKIVEIIDVINSIAFQTNILALNAAIEAARAGEHGRGFSVVAAEVRNLAQKSAAAADNIKSIINQSSGRISAGQVDVEKANAIIEDVGKSIDRVQTLVNEIAVASGEQSSGIDQINQAVVHLDQNTQQNAALVEEMSAAAEGLKQQSADLVSVVGQFKTNR